MSYDMMKYKQNEMTPEQFAELEKRLKSVFGVSKKELNKINQTVKDLIYLDLIPAQITKAAQKAYPANPLMYYFLQVLSGNKIGLSGIDSIHGICIIYNKPLLYGDMVKVVIERQSSFRGIASIYDAEKMGYIVKVHRAFKNNDGSEEIVTYEAFFNYAAAKTAGFLDRDNWKNHTIRRIELKAMHYAAKGAYPSLFSFIGIKEEEEDHKADSIENDIEIDESEIEVDKEIDKLTNSVIQSSESLNSSFPLGFEEEVIINKVDSHED